MRSLRSVLLRPCTSSLLLFALAAAAQAPASKPADATFGGEPFVVLHQSSVFSMQADGTGFREVAVAVRIQSEAALKRFGVVSVAFASAAEHVDLHYVRVRHPDGTVTETPVAQAMEQPAPVTREAPFYSDLKELQLPVRSLKLGDTVEWEARVVVTNVTPTPAY